MASLFPNALPGAKTDYDNADVVASADPNALAEDVNALGAKVGKDSSAVTTSHDYKLSGVTGSDVAVSKTGTETLTNKTLTNPTITTGTFSSPTGIVKGDVGLGNVDNTSDATKNAASVTLANKTIDGDDNTLQDIAYSSIKSTSRSGSDATLITGTKGTSADLAVWNADGDLVDGPTPPSGTILGTTDTQTLTNKNIVQKVTSYTPAGAGTATLDVSIGGIHSITMPAGNITIAISNEVVGKCFMIEITQDGGGSRTVTWFSTIAWCGSAPTLTTTASKTDTFGFRVTGTDTYRGYIIGQNA